MTIEAEVREIKQQVIGISEKMDELIYEREMTALMKLAEKSLSDFFGEEPGIYKIKNQDWGAWCYEGKRAKCESGVEVR